MTQLTQLLKQEYARHPKMELVDAAKFIFQHTLGGGHLIKDEKAAARWLKQETGSCQAVQEPLFSALGNGFCRMHLYPVKQTGISDETVAGMFLSSAKRPVSNAEKLTENLQAIKTLPFDTAAVDAYLQAYQKDGCPLVRHSATYRAAYHPAYRVVAEDMERYFSLLCRIDALLQTNNDVLVAIDGKCASGKTTLASMLQTVFQDCTVFHMDDFFLRPAQRTAARLEEPGGNVDRERFFDEVLQPAAAGKTVRYRPYDCQSGVLLPTAQEKTHTRLTIVEGAYSRHPLLDGCYTLRVFLDVDAQRQRERIQKRNGEAMLRRFEEIWIPLENRYFAAFFIRETSDLLFTV